jgi:hypothetical protein
MSGVGASATSTATQESGTSPGSSGTSGATGVSIGGDTTSTIKPVRLQLVAATQSATVNPANCRKPLAELQLFVMCLFATLERLNQG